MKLAEAEPEVLAALDRMKLLPKSLRPSVIVEDTVTRKFVQFRGSDVEWFLVDLPTSELSSEAARAASRILRHNGNARFPAFQVELANSDGAARVGMRVLREVHELPEFAELRIVEQQVPKTEQN